MRHLLEHVPGHVLVRHVPEHVLGHMLEHILRHVPTRHVSRQWACTQACAYQAGAVRAWARA